MNENELKICERFKKIRTDLRLKQGDFAREIKTTQGHVSDIENKRKGVSDRIIEIICLKYLVSEDWIRHGIGDMYRYDKTDDYSQIAILIGKKDPKARQAILDYWRLSKEDKELFWSFIDKFIKKTGV